MSVEYRLKIIRKTGGKEEETLLDRPTTVFREDGKLMESVTPDLEYKVFLSMADDLARCARYHFSKILGEELARKMFVRSFVGSLFKDLCEVLDNDIEKLKKEGSR